MLSPPVMDYEVRVFITLKDGVPDTNGQGILGGLRSLGIAEGVNAVHTGKVIDLAVTSTADEIDNTVTEMCQQLLAHPVIEQYRYQLAVRFAGRPPMRVSQGEPDKSDTPITEFSE